MKLFQKLTGMIPRKDSGNPTCKDERGIALITVIALVSLLSVLCLAIISLAGNELRSSQAYSDNVRVRQLADTAITLVIGQIRQATRPDRNKTLFGRSIPSLWASQPGMIRTFRDAGMLEAAFKLYSSSHMIVTDETDLLGENDRLLFWEGAPHRYVDLNAPSIVYDNEGREIARYFPIIDPRARGP